MFSKSTLNDIRDRVPIASLIGERMPLKRSGRNLKGLCPFHQEKSPSFMVNEEKQIFHCFGCGAGGDIFRFVMDFDGIDFPEAVRYLAGRAGVELVEDADPAQRRAEEERTRERKWFLRINQIAQDYFAQTLADVSRGGPAREYLQTRGIQDEFWTQHFLGYADKSWDALERHLRAKGVPLEMAATLGLIRARDGGGHYDFFRHRLIFPIRSPRGEVLGFGGRALPQEGGEDGAKYMNSPDSPIYHKSNSVFGLDLAAGAIRSNDQVILVEGYMDRIALHQFGVCDVVAPLGTALTSGHLTILARYSRNHVLVFDGDEAGRRAALRSLDIYLAAGMMPRVVPLPAGEDPDTLIRSEGAEAFRRRFENAPSLISYFVDATTAQVGRDAAGSVEALKRIVPVLRQVSDPIERGIYRREAAARLGLDEREVERALGLMEKTSSVQLSSSPKAVAYVSGASTERLLVQAMLAHPETVPSVFESLAPDAFEDGWCRTVVTLVEQSMHEGSMPVLSAFIDAVVDEELSAEIRRVAMEGESIEPDEVREVVGDCVKRMQQRRMRERSDRLTEAIARATVEGNEDQVLELMRQKQDLSQQMQR